MNIQDDSVFNDSISAIWTKTSLTYLNTQYYILMKMSMIIAFILKLLSLRINVHTSFASNHVGFGRREQLIKDLPMHGKRVGIYVNTRRMKCKSCTKIFFL